MTDDALVWLRQVFDPAGDWKGQPGGSVRWSKRRRVECCSRARHEVALTLALALAPGARPGVGLKGRQSVRARRDVSAIALHFASFACWVERTIECRVAGILRLLLSRPSSRSLPLHGDANADGHSRLIFCGACKYDGSR